MTDKNVCHVIFFVLVVICQVQSDDEIKDLDQTTKKKEFGESFLGRKSLLRVSSLQLTINMQ